MKEKVVELVMLSEELNYLVNTAEIHKKNIPLHTVFLQRAKAVIAEMTAIEDELKPKEQTG